ncbi:ABC transporter ATP-binding protein [Clostridium thailandense]|uniref:ABC transporter ATP-binding protein n=1 Tax=Clostridium thailandense TaxID=2794346 RepID=UPI0039894C36
MEILKTDSLKKYYGKEENLVKALDGINISIEEEGFTAIVGTFGSGKSTLLHLIGGLDEKDVNEDYVKELMEILGIYDKKNMLTNALSGGQQQRVAIARALSTKPSIILADEPTGNLDSKTGQEVMNLLKLSVKKYHQTLVMITHNDKIAQMADRVIRIEDGKIVGGLRNE